MTAKNFLRSRRIACCEAMYLLLGFRCAVSAAKRCEGRNRMHARVKEGWMNRRPG